MSEISDFGIVPIRDWQRHERFLRDLYAAMLEDPLSQLHARSGFGQNGVDIYGTAHWDHGLTGISAKLRLPWYDGRLTARHLRAEVNAAKRFRPRLRRLILATTTPRDARLQEEARRITAAHAKRGLFEVHVHCWEDIVDALGRHPSVARTWYPRYARADEDAVVQTATSKIPQAAGTNNFPGASTGMKRAVTLLSAQHYDALGMLLTCPFPLNLRWLSRFAPHISWTAVLRELSRNKLIALHEDTITLIDGIDRRFLPEEPDNSRFRTRWIALLEPLAGHVDAALFLIVLFFSEHRHAEAVELLSHTASGLPHGYWPSLFAKCFQPVIDSPLAKRLSAEHRITLLHAVSVCELGSDSPQVAISTLDKLSSLADRHNDFWTQGQVLINTGVALQLLGDHEAAADKFNAALRHARRHRDHVLRGRAAYNLSLIRNDQGQFGEVERLLAESLAAKRLSRDPLGVIGVIMGRAELAGRQGDHRRALRLFRRAESAAKKSGNSNARAMAIANIGVEHTALGNHSAARSAYRRARKLAEEDGWSRLIDRAVEGEAYATLYMGRSSDAAALFDSLIASRETNGDFSGAVHARHDRAVMLWESGHTNKGRAALEAALEQARMHQLDDWIYRCIVSRAGLGTETGDPTSGLSSFAQAIEAEEKSGANERGAKLRLELLEQHLEQESSGAILFDLLAECRKKWKQFPRAIDDRVRLLKLTYCVYWQCGRCGPAMKALEDLAAFAGSHGMTVTYLEAMADLGMRLTELEKYGDALKVMRRVLAEARKHKEEPTQSHLLNNLGECCRRAGRFKSAIKWFEKADQFAAARHDTAERISVAHNLALAIAGTGDTGGARAILRRCCAIAKRDKIEHEYVRSLHGLAILSAKAGRWASAIRRYEEALKAAQRFDLTHDIMNVSVNLAQCMSHQGDHRAALRLLRQHPPSPTDPELGLQWHRQAAESFEGLGESAKAISAWQNCRDCARTLNAGYELSLAAERLSRLYSDQAQYSQADESLRAALDADIDVDSRAVLLRLRVEVLLELDGKREINRCIGELRRIADNAAGVREILIDTYMLVGERNFREKAYSAAFLAYAFAIATALPSLPQPFAAAVRHAVQRYLSVLRREPSDADARTERELLRMIHGDSRRGKAARHFERLALAPIRIARRFHAVRPRALSARQVGGIFAAELRLLD